MIDAPPAYDAAPQPSPIVAAVVGVDGVQPTMSVAAAPVQQPVEATLESRIHSMQLELDLPEEIVRDLLSVSGTDIVVIADDSSSMNTVSDATDISRPITRWGELRSTLEQLVHLLLVVDHSDGFALKFLNDPSWYQINSAEGLAQVFSAKPQARGLTPLMSNLKLIANGYTGGAFPEGDTIVLVLTDGEPSDCKLPQIQQMLQGRAKNVFMTFMMCTEEDSVVEAYNQCVDPIWGCDITDGARRAGSALAARARLARHM